MRVVVALGGNAITGPSGSLEADALNYLVEARLGAGQLDEAAALAAQQAAINKVKPGNHWNEPHDAAVKAITKGLKKLGLLDGTLPVVR